ncbi:hypothetical protein RHMOL_Rhmol12G0158500 [Rhododendron molle]|uniref:Uncharacterized protein n=1 Tax=Rhododendron molle TaxID=49168 RepID=A0ACC0LJT7_RHOML|nr:hypothetical protein RHMOL_Rhmol12G0158500 [Rhododendron molle]
MIRQLPWVRIYRECGQAFERVRLVNPFGSTNGIYMHGICCLLSSTKMDYFKAAIAQRDKIDFLSIFTNAGVKPSWDATYTKDAIENAVKGHTGTAVYVSCRKMNNTCVKLFEIYICLDVPGAKYEDRDLFLPLIFHRQMGVKSQRKGENVLDTLPD